MGLNEMTAHQLRALLQKGEVSAREITQSVLRAIDEKDESLKSFITVTGEEALQKADDIDDRLKRGEEVGPLAGIPVAVKDNICTKGIETTCASKILRGFMPPYDATVIARLKEADAIIIGKTNLDEFAMGSSTENSAFFQTKNPWDTTRVPGGSSGGSAASVAADETLLALGSDTGGSIRQPAAFCGVVGLKPTYGRVSRYGLIGLASSMDQIGPMAKNVIDAALLLGVIAGHDGLDPTSGPTQVPDYIEGFSTDLSGMKIGLPKEFIVDGLAEDVKDAFYKATETFCEMGAECIEISLPHVKYADSTYYALVQAEASSSLSRYDGVRVGYRDEEPDDVLNMFRKTRGQGFGPEAKRRIILGTYILSSGNYEKYYVKAQKVRTLIIQDFKRAFQGVDLILAPTSPSAAFKLGERRDDVLQMYLADIYTTPANLAGIPSISVPCALSRGLPLGLQIMGKPFAEEVLLKVAYAFEKNVDFRRVEVGKGGRC